jgi:hypothetical protein
VIGDIAMQKITSVITTSLAETDGTRSVHWNAAKTDHRTPFEVRVEHDLKSGVFLPAACFVIQA